MRKVTAFIGTARKEHTHYPVRQFLNSLDALGGVEHEVVVLTDYRLGFCRGCKNCFSRGEETKLCAFRAARTSMRTMLEESSRDFTSYREKGWFESRRRAALSTR